MIRLLCLFIVAIAMFSIAAPSEAACGRGLLGVRGRVANRIERRQERRANGGVGFFGWGGGYRAGGCSN